MGAIADPAETSAPPVARGQNLASPSFLGALRGVWLFMWRSQLAWRRMPMRIFALLALPFLVYITTSSHHVSPQRRAVLGSPVMQLDVFSRRLFRAGLPLRPEQRAPLLLIFQEEFARAAGDGESQAGESNADWQSRQVKACYDGIGARIQTVLDERQVAAFESFESRNVVLSRNRANEPVWNWSDAFYRWLVDLYFFIVLPLSCVWASGALIRDELQSDTLGFLTTRPLSRARLLVVKYLSQAAWLQIAFLLETALLFAAGGLRHIPAIGALLPLFLAAQVLAVFAWSALGAFLGLVTRRYVAMALLYGLFVEMGIGRIPTNINNLSLMRHLKTLLAHNPAVQRIYEWPGAGVPLSVGALMLATVVFLSLAAVLFTFVEYHHSVEMQK
ncbi:MAG TPA: ABC transporter permease subunit [Verrucomicrobiae bacterium]|nr:ABC transporter permease subunit [Verrucomicrobiae bacterium]